MRKLLFFLTVAALASGVVSCDNEPKNPGDFTVKSTLNVDMIKSMTTGETYNLSVARSFDTIFKTPVQVWDTIYDANGEFLERNADTIWVPSKFTTRYIETQPVVLPSVADTFSMDLTTNAKWLSPNPTIVDLPWIYNESTTGGGGDGTIIFRVARNRNFARSLTPMLIYTSDSTVFYKIPFGQTGEKE